MKTYSHPRIAGSHADTDKTREALYSRPISELERHKLTVTPDEKHIGKLASIGSGLGNTALIASGWQFAITPVEQVGLGLTVGTVAGISIMSIVCFATVLLTIPLSYYAYEEYMIETDALQKEIKQEEATRTQNRQDLFFEILRLRCLHNDAEYDQCLKKLNLQSKEVDQTKLLTLVNDVYLRSDFKTELYHFDNNGQLNKADEKVTHQHKTLYTTFKNSALAQDQSVRNKIVDEFKANDRSFETKLDGCFNPIKPLPTFYGKPFAYGVAGTAMFAATLFGTYWTFAGIIVGAGICASIPMIGWAVLALACIAASIALGIWVARSKNKNMQREALQHRLEERNNELVDTTNVVRQECLKKYLQDLNSQPQTRLEDALVKKIEAKADERLQDEISRRKAAEARVEHLEKIAVDTASELRKQHLLQQLAPAPLAESNNMRMFRSPDKQKHNVTIDEALKIKASLF